MDCNSNDSDQRSKLYLGFDFSTQQVSEQSKKRKEMRTVADQFCGQFVFLEFLFREVYLSRNIHERIVIFVVTDCFFARLSVQCLIPNFDWRATLMFSYTSYFSICMLRIHSFIANIYDINFLFHSRKAQRCCRKWEMWNRSRSCCSFWFWSARISVSTKKCNLQCICHKSVYQ